MVLACPPCLASRSEGDIPMVQFARNPFIETPVLPVEIVLSPSWWYKHAGITFDRDFFYHPAKRVESERRMEQVLHEIWGRFGLGAHRNEDRPEVGPVHLAAGYLLSEMLGCRVEYAEDQPPQVVCARSDASEIDTDAAFESRPFRDFQVLMESLKARHGRLCGDTNFSGILNIALDLRGEDIFIDMHDDPDRTRRYLRGIAGVMERFAEGVRRETGTSSISVNRSVRHIARPVFLHSECSLTMVSVENYEDFLMPFDAEWSTMLRPFGIHYCGADPHRYAQAFARLPHLDFLDLGWGGDVKVLREHLPDTFFNIRLSPVEIVRQSVSEVRETVARLVRESGNPWLTGVCCINMDDAVTPDKIDAIFETVQGLREECSGAA